MPMVAAFAAVSVAVLVFALGMVMRARRQLVRTGLGHLVGSVATVESVNNGITWARLDGELWEVACPEELVPEDRVVVNEIDGLTLKVSKEEGAKT
jgi:membrane-bound serine protease (ClpP class)